jgi:acetoacetate decarboxylase
MNQFLGGEKMKFALDDEELTKLVSRMVGAKAVFFDAEMAMIFFRTDPDVVKHIIPEPLKPSAEPFAMAFIAKYPRTNFGSVYNEAALTLIVEYEGKLGGYCLTMPVTEDMACIQGREIFGFPKKIADEISLEKTKNGVKGRYVRRGIELMNLSMSFDEEVEASKLVEMLSTMTSQELGDNEWKAISYNFKFFNSPQLTGFDYKPRLVKQVTTFKPSSRIKMSYNFDFKLGSSDRDPLAEIPVKEPIMGFYGVFNNTMHSGEVIAEVEEEQFIRYAFSKIDSLPE